MIKVTRKDYSLTVEGHAGYADKGMDIVCSAASILFYTLCVSLSRRKIDFTKREEEGNAKIKADVCTAFTFDADVTFDTICAGYIILAQNYPENVYYEDIS